MDKGENEVEIVGEVEGEDQEVTVEDYKRATYEDVVKCKCKGDIELHFQMNPLHSYSSTGFFQKFYWCTDEGRKRIEECLEKGRNGLL